MGKTTDAIKNRNTAKIKLKINENEARRLSGDRTVSKYRTEFMRDRDRVLYSKAFRRLAGKAQVYISGVDDHKRTRLTHTLEVSQIARSIAAPLKLDVDLVEAIALGHDLGHTPFGHAGERTLHAIMTPGENHILGPSCPLNIPAGGAAPAELEPFLGFKHNLQSLVVAMGLEKNYGDTALDLTNYTLYGLQAHSKPRYKAGFVPNHDKLGYYRRYLDEGCRTAEGDWAWSLESLLVAEADEIAQRHHDVEDALFGGLITREEVVSIIRANFGDTDPFRKLSAGEKAILDRPSEYEMDAFVALISRVIVNMLVTRLTETAAYQINKIGQMTVMIDGKAEPVANRTFRAFRREHAPDDAVVGGIFRYISAEDENNPDKSRPAFADRIKAFEGDISRRVLSSYDIQKADARGTYIIEKLFQAYYATPQQLPDHCVFELLSEYSSMEQNEACRTAHPEWFRSEFCTIPAGERGKLGLAEDASFRSYLRTKRTLEGVGGVRRLFSDLYSRREQTTVLEELLLMRVICNHIACMTDTYAQRTYRELYG